MEEKDKQQVKKTHQPDKTKNMKIRKTKSGLQSPENREHLSTSLFDPRAPGDRFSKLKVKTGRK